MDGWPPAQCGRIAAYHTTVVLLDKEGKKWQKGELECAHRASERFLSDNETPALAEAS